MNWKALQRELEPNGLFVMGSLHESGDTLILIGAGKSMWLAFKNSAEYNDNAPDPLDRWSKRVLGSLCASRSATAIFPSDGPPYAPFIAWAKKSGRFWQSPTGMLVHDEAGLMVSIRGALRVGGLAVLPNPPSRCPCGDCIDRPCTSACPVGALSADRAYDVPACKAHLHGFHGSECMEGGCLARRACPVSQSFGRDPEQSAFHMDAFLPR